MSNIGAFVDEHPEDASIVKINQVIFGQPGHVLSAPVCFNFSSVKDGDMVYTVTWPTAALGVAEEEEERVVDEICKSIQADFEALA
ncbi:L-amino acid oxidase [Colletotrichum truncatum]|uniref:L-amino acid oxidase n=1 Tax=Colletotrichum truncatum TaxID=5467 RepID=A0ACC3ZFY0_COLTU